MRYGELTPEQAASAVEHHECPNCAAPAGSLCRTCVGKAAAQDHTPRFSLVPALREELDVAVPKALTLARQFAEAVPKAPVILTMHELKRLARSAAELMMLSAELQASGIRLEMLSGPLTGIYDPDGRGSMLFAVLAVAAQEATIKTGRNGRFGTCAARNPPGR